MKAELSGECFVPGFSGKRIEADHLARYRFALGYANGKTVLDMACGSGYAGPMLTGGGAISYDGVDINPQTIEYARAEHGSPSIRYHVGDLCAACLGTTYQLITCFETIEHVNDYKAALSNLFRLLEPGGTLLISSPNRPITSPGALSIEGKPENPFHVREFTPEELVCKLRDAGFNVRECDIFGQRLRRAYPSRFLRKLVRVIFGDPDRKSSPEVKPVDKLVPRYFVVRATKG